MNVLYILGNGFDLAQGMKTIYPDFYRYLKWWRLIGSPELIKMKKAINNDNALWSNMEEALGLYTDQFKDEDIERFRNLYLRLSDILQDYLRREENKFSNRLSWIPGLKIIDDMLDPTSYLLGSDKKTIRTDLPIFVSQ